MPSMSHKIVTAPKSETRRIFVATGITGLVRAEWAMARWNQATPINWSKSEYLMWLNQFSPLGFLVAEARNVAVKEFLEKGFEWCLRPDTLVETKDGAKAINAIQEGDLVRTHLGRLRPVTKVFKRIYPQRNPLRWIRTKHSTIKCTPEHPFFILRDGQRTFIRAKDLILSDLLLYPISSLVSDKLPIDIHYNTAGENGKAVLGAKKMGKHITELEITRDMARLFGLYAAEGCAIDAGISFTFSNDEIDLSEFVTKISKEVFDRIVTKDQRWATRVNINIRSLGKVFKEWFGERANVKRIPRFVWSWSMLNRLEFLKGYLDGDGHLTGSVWSFISASRALVEDICSLARSCNLDHSNVIPVNPSCQEYQGRRIQNGGAYVAYIKTKATRKLLDILQAKIDEEWAEIPIISIEEHSVSACLIDEYVYNLEVAEDNSYIADCAAVHNCIFIDHDTILPPTFLITVNERIMKEHIPIWSGLYFTKSVPSEPLVFRGKGNGYFSNWKMGDKVWVDSIPLGCAVIHRSILQVAWDEAEDYEANGMKMKRVFETPVRMWEDAKTKTWQTQTGTEDLNFCWRLKDKGMFKKAGWPEYQKKEHPFLIDTNVFCKHITPDGTMFPAQGEEKFFMKKGK